jgi:uncharacterized protein (TIGR00266 family)
MIATSIGVAIEAKIEGGLMKGLKRSVLGGESLFITTFTAPQQGGWVDVAATQLPGDIRIERITPDRPLLITRGCWVANSFGVGIDTKWGGMKNLFGGEGGFLINTTGDGLVVLSAYGAIDEILLGPNDAVTIDSGHVVAFDASTRSQLRRASQKGFIQSMKSGEGLVFDFAGPGRVLMQSRNPSNFVGWLKPQLPSG